MGRFRQAAACFAFLGLSFGVAQAGGLLNDDPYSYKDAPRRDWVVTIGGYGALEPEFPGSKDYTVGARLIFDFYRAGDREWLTLPNDATSITLYEAGNFRIGAAGDYISNRSLNDAHGLHTIDYTLEVGGFAEFYPAPFLRTRAELLQGVTGAEGFVANLMADFIYAPAPRWQFTVGPRLKFVDNDYNDTFFSITSRDNYRTGLPVYRAEGGLYSAGVDATVRYDVTERISLRAFAEWNRLTGDAADSPLVQRWGSEDQFQVGVGAAYKFNFAF